MEGLAKRPDLEGLTGTVIAGPDRQGLGEKGGGKPRYKKLKLQGLVGRQIGCNHVSVM